MPCLHCGSERLYLDSITTETVCNGCGLVQEGPQLFSPVRPSEPTGFGRATSRMNPNVADGNGQRLSGDMVGNMWRLRRTEVRASHEPVGTLVDSFDVVVLARKIGVPDLVAYEAAEIHRTWRKEYSAQNGLTNAACTVGCIVLAARKYRVPIDIESACNTGDAEEDAVWRAVRRIKKQCPMDGLRNLLAEPVPYIGMASSRLRIPEVVRTAALALLEKAPDRGFKPSCMAGGALIVAFRQTHTPMTFTVDALAKVCGTTEHCLNGAVQVVGGVPPPKVEPTLIC